VSEFHQSPQWIALAKQHKAIQRAYGRWACVDCGKKGELDSGHILPQEKWKMSRLWLSCLVLQCRDCNLKLGDNIRWSIQAVKLLGIYMIIKGLKIAAIVLIVIILGQYYYYDCFKNDCTIKNQISYNYGQAKDMAGNTLDSLIELWDRMESK